MNDRLITDNNLRKQITASLYWSLVHPLIESAQIVVRACSTALRTMSCGELQINRFHLVVFFTWQLCLYFANQQLFPIFSNYSPRFRCVGSNDSAAFHKNCTALAECPADMVEYEDKVFYSSVLEFDLVCGSYAYIASLITSMQFFGVLIGTITYGHLADKFGRRPISLLCVSLGILFVVLSGSLGIFCFETNVECLGASLGWLILLILRFFVGTSIGGTVVVYTYVIELIEPQQRMFLRAFFNWVSAMDRECNACN